VAAGRTVDEIDAEEVRRFLVDTLGEDAADVEFVANGEWSRCFSFTSAGLDLVVRFGRHLEDFEKDRAASLHARPNLRIPEVYDIGDAFDGYYAISRRIFGTPLDDLSAEGWREILPELFATLDAARAADISATTGFGIWAANGEAPYESWREFLVSAGDDRPDRRIHGWRALLEESPTGDGPFREALQLLEARVDSCPESRHLVHSDLHLNAFVSDGTISGLLDWGCSLYGDFLYDHAWLAFWAPWYPANDGIDFVAETLDHLKSIGEDVDDNRVEERMLCYQIHIGLDAQSYNAYTRRWLDLSTTAERTLALARTL
jgi:hygromycin-B 4-O-kinase